MSEARTGPEVVIVVGDAVSWSRTFMVAVYVSTLCSPCVNFVKEEVAHCLLELYLDRQYKVATSSIIGSLQVY